MARSVAGRPAAMGKLTPGSRTVLRIGTTGSIKVSDIPTPHEESGPCAADLQNDSDPFNAKYGPAGRVDSKGFRTRRLPRTGRWFRLPGSGSRLGAPESEGLTLDN